MICISMVNNNLKPALSLFIICTSFAHITFKLLSVILFRSPFDIKCLYISSAFRYLIQLCNPEIIFPNEKALPAENSQTSSRLYRMFSFFSVSHRTIPPASHPIPAYSKLRALYFRLASEPPGLDLEVLCN